jgi:hypothetical protein
MHAPRVGPDLSSAIWQAGREATEEIERKDERRRCRKSVAKQLRKLNEAKPSNETRVRAAWIAAKCRRCRGCSLAPD